MPDLVRDDIGLCEVARCAETAQIVPEAQVDVYLFVPRAVERTGSRACGAAAGVGGIAEENEPRMAIAGQDAAPGLLCIVQHKRHELRGALLLCRGWRGRSLLLHRAGIAHQICANKIATCDQADDQQDQQSTDSEPASPAETDAAAAFAAPVLDIAAEPTGCPVHG